MIFISDLSQATVKRLAYWGLAMILLQALVGLVQYLAGGHLDGYLFSSQTVTIGNRAVLGGLEQFWTPGQRIFATMGHYQLLASFLAIGLIMIFPWFYILEDKKKRIILGVVFILMLSALILAYSRAGWLAFILGILVIVKMFIKDKRTIVAFGLGIVLVASYLSVFSLVQGSFGQIVDKPSQGIAERALEAVSFRSWRESYEGYGRIFFIINTPRVVVANHPFFGVGLGNYGGGVAAALLNTDAYDRLHLPFGIQNYFGQIDNNWLSIWGELGTFGVLAWLSLYLSILLSAKYLEKKTKDPFALVWAQGTFGIIIGLMALGFFGPYFEFRTLMFYVWSIVGVLFLFLKQEKNKNNFLDSESKSSVLSTERV